MGFSSSRRVSGWASIVWFTAAVGVAVGQGVTLQTTPLEHSARCGENVTLTCNATSPHPLDVKLFSWVANHRTVCPREDGPPDPEVRCEGAAESRHRALTLTLRDVMPVHQGEYLCKLQSTRGGMSAKTVLTVQDCLGPSGYSISESGVKCWFDGVYPSGTVHWFRGDVNLTDSASTRGEEDQHGRYNVSSTIDVQKGRRPRKCALWIPSAGKYLSDQQLPEGQTLPASSSVVGLQWICMMVEITVVIFMTR